ncbi:class D beta-lactamase [Massilia sp. ZL223]|uniref:class D beta-lactamase n=1 Tax=Massilia sp. ZL223 TaxID=2824904 RepID=UPI001B82D5E9|nr:class D beta-lactamase [Massilia sp. ZL223]MBQ5962628.1 class D beta-lactamase [Massilia sp. ZL223]
MHMLSGVAARLLLSLAALLAAQSAHAALPDVDIGARFREARVEGTFVLLDGRSGEIRRHAPARAAQGFLPASTYKIPNTLIALEEGAARDKDVKLAWDSARAPRQPWWPASWAQDHTLESALKNSAVWYYQEMARRIGPSRMQHWVDRFGYGNRDISGGIDQFWLTGGLRISADQQVDFLRRFYAGQLGVSARTTRLAKEMLVLEETPDYRLSGKSGWAGFGAPQQPQLGWLVGYLEREGEVHFFAMNLDIARPGDTAARMNILKAVLRDFRLLP